MTKFILEPGSGKVLIYDLAEDKLSSDAYKTALPGGGLIGQRDKLGKDQDIAMEFERTDALTCRTWIEMDKT